MGRAWAIPLLFFCAAAAAAPRQAPDLSVAGTPEISAIPALPAVLPLVQADPVAALSPASPVPVAAVRADAPKTPLSMAQELATARHPEQAQALAFDNLNGTDADPGSVEPETPRPPKIPRPSGLARAARGIHHLLNGRPGSSRHWFTQSAAVGLAVGAAAPALWHAAPVETVMLSLPAAVLLGLGVALVGAIVSVVSTRARLTPPRPARTRRAKTLLAAAGLALGLALAAVPHHFEGPIVEQAAAVYAPADAVRYAGPVLGARMETLLAQNDVGRGILDGLRDRGGVVRMPAFFVAQPQDGSTAFHTASVDAVFIDRAEIKGRGWTVEEFLRRPELQARLAYDLQDVLAHELVHAGQARRSALERNHFKQSFSKEEEAYLVEHFYEHARLKADPHADVSPEDLGEYESILDGVNGYLDSMRDMGSYRKDVDAPTPTYLAFRARVDAGWQAHRVEGYRLLAEHYAKVPALRERLLKKAAQAALP